MPNWAYNSLLVMGDPQEIKRFQDTGIGLNKDGERIWTMSKYFPTPEPLTRTVSSSPPPTHEFTNVHDIEIAKNRIANGEQNVVVPDPIPCANNTPEKRAQLIKEYGFDNWYDWCCENWGTKWDAHADDDNIEISETSIRVSFDTAWSPPMNWLYKVQKDYPTLKFKLFFTEESHDITGILYTNQNGELDEIEGDYIHTDEDGNKCWYDDDDEVWRRSDSDEIIEDELFSPDSYSSLENHKVWFE